MNSKRKGKVGEREFAALLREEGFDARRGQQFAGSADSPDVVSDALAWLHFEIKRAEALNLADACAQAEGDCGGKPWVVAHRRNHAPWLITMRAETFFRLLRGNFDSLAPAHSAPEGPSPTANSFRRFPSDSNLRGVLPPEEKPNQQPQQTEQTQNV
jgi:hypothetical protein